MRVEVGGQSYLDLAEAIAYLDGDFLNSVPVYFQYRGVALLHSREVLVNGMIRIDPNVFKRMRIPLGEGKPVIVFGCRSGDGMMSDGRGWIGYKGRNLDFECGKIDGEEINVTLGLRELTMPHNTSINEAAFFVNQSSLDAVGQQLGIKPNGRNGNGQTSTLLEQKMPIPTEREDEKPIVAKEPDQCLIEMVEPKTKDDWFYAIRDCIKEFEDEHGYTPNRDELWGRLRNDPPATYGITSDKDRGEAAVILDDKALDKEAFRKRYKRYYSS